MQGSNALQLLRERGYINSSAAQLDDVIGQAQAVRYSRTTKSLLFWTHTVLFPQAVASLAGQRTLFVDMGAKMGAVGAKFPVVNSLVSAIRRKKSKEAFILAAVVASCTLFTLVYWSYK